MVLQGQPNIGSELFVVKDFVNGATGIDMGPGDSKPFNLTPFNNALYYTTTTASSLFKLEYTPSAIVKFKTQVSFDASNYKIPQPLVVFKENLSYFYDAELEFSSNAGKALLLSTDKVNYGPNVILSGNEIDTIWVKVHALSPDSSFRNFTVSTIYIDKNDMVEVPAEATVSCRIEPVFRGDLMYLVEAGKKDPTTIESTEKMGKSQSSVDQAFGADPVTGKQWGYEGSLWNKDDGADKWGSLRETNNADVTLTYKFEVDNADYIVHMGFQEFWGGRTTGVAVNGNQLDNVVLTSSNNRVMRTTKVTVTDNLITIGITKIQDNAEISWIKIGQVIPGTNCFDPECERRDAEYDSLMTSIPTVPVVNSFSVFPNPSSGLVNLKVTENIFNTCEVYGIDGKLILTSLIDQNQSLLNLNIPNKGMYIIKLNGRTSTATQKVIIE